MSPGSALGTKLHGVRKWPSPSRSEDSDKANSPPQLSVLPTPSRAGHTPDLQSLVPLACKTSSLSLLKRFKVPRSSEK